jgi:hypothetical protein
MARHLLTIVIASVLAAACSDAPPASTSPPGSGGESISGTERIGWTQPAASAAELAQYRYAVYVNGVRRLLEPATCTPAMTTAGFPCEAPLPALTPGPHTLEIAAFFLTGGATVEGPRSAPLQVTVRGATAPAFSSTWPDRLVSPEGRRLDVQTADLALTDPVDLAISQEGTVLVAERGGRILLYRDGMSMRDAGDNVLDLFRRDGDTELQSLAVAPDFDRTGVLYLVMRVAHDEGSSLLLARVRAVRGVMGEAAVLWTDPIPHEATAVLRVGPDAHLYLGVGTGTEPASAQRLSDAGARSCGSAAMAAYRRTTRG